LALVEVAGDLGVKVTAARTDVAGVEKLQGPLIVHFAGDEKQGGFGILERVTQDGFWVWDSRNGRQLVDRTTFEKNWSGIVGLVDRDDTHRTSEPGYLTHRLMELLVGSGAPPALIGSRAAPFLRIAFAVILGTLLSVAAVDHPAGTRGSALALMGLTIVGLWVTAALALAGGDQAKNFTLPGCPRGKLVDCESVLTSPYSHIAGIPLSEIGIAFFGAILLLMATAAIAADVSEIWSVVALAYLLSLPAALLLVGVQIFMRRFCTLCLLVHGVIAGGAGLSLLFLDAEVSPSEAIPAAILLSAYLLMFLFLVIPYFTRTQRMKTFVESQQRVASSPFATLAHILTEQPIAMRGADCGIRLEGPPASHELILFVHPSCAACAHTIREAVPLATAGKVEVFLAVASKDREESDRRACDALVAAGLGLGPDAFLEAYSFAKNGLSALAEDPIPILAEHLSVEPTRIAGGLEAAERVVRRAEELADSYVEGTPATFFDSRLYPYTAPLGHLAFLLERHPELLEATVVSLTELPRLSQEAATS
jgi:uncharacterized membrane protein